MQNNQNSNTHQVKQASKRSHTFRPSVQTTSEKVEVHPECVGLIIGRGGKNIKELIASHPGIKIQGPRRDDPRQIFRISGAKETVAAAVAEIRSVVDNWTQRNASRLQHEERRVQHKVKAQDEWAQRIQDSSGCVGTGWSTKGSAEADAWRVKQKHRLEGFQISHKRQPIANENRFEIPSDSEDEVEQSGPAIAEPTELTGAWSKGAPKEQIEPPVESKQLDVEEANAQFAKHLATRKPIASWADAADSDDDEEESNANEEEDKKMSSAKNEEQ